MPHILKGLMKAKIVPFRMSSTETVPEFHPDIARGTFEDVYKIEHMFWNKKAVGTMANKYEGMEKEAVRDWKMHVGQFLSMRLRFLRQASSFLTDTTTPKELGTAVSFSYDQRLKEPRKTLLWEGRSRVANNVDWRTA